MSNDGPINAFILFAAVIFGVASYVYFSKTKDTKDGKKPDPVWVGGFITAILSLVFLVILICRVLI